MASGEDSHFANISASVIQPASSEEAVAAAAKSSGNGKEEDCSLGSEMMRISNVSKANELD